MCNISVSVSLLILGMLNDLFDDVKWKPAGVFVCVYGGVGMV